MASSAFSAAFLLLGQSLQLCFFCFFCALCLRAFLVLFAPSAWLLRLVLQPSAVRTEPSAATLYPKAGTGKELRVRLAVLSSGPKPRRHWSPLSGTHTHASLPSASDSVSPKLLHPTQRQGLASMSLRARLAALSPGPLSREGTAALSRRNPHLRITTLPFSFSGLLAATPQKGGARPRGRASSTQPSPTSRELLSPHEWAVQPTHHSPPFLFL